MNQLTASCAHCAEPFIRRTSQRYCSLHCAIWSRIDRREPDQCWPWNGARTKAGYGQFTFLGKKMSVTRALMNPHDDLDVLHSCDNPCCCNPGHLRVGTHSENMKEMIKRERRRPQRGENAPRAILSDRQAAEIKAMLGKVRQVDLAKMFNVGRHVIADISAGRSWKGA